MRFAGCAATSHEAAAALGGNDILVRSRGDLIDAARPLEALRFLAGLGSGVEKLRVLARSGCAKMVEESARADCEVGADLTRRLRLPAAVVPGRTVCVRALRRQRSPAGLAGDEVSEAARFAAVGFAAVMFDAVGGLDLAVETVARWSGRALDPWIAAAFLEAPTELLAISNPDDVWAAVVDTEPQPRRLFRDEAHLDEALAGFGDAADLKSPFFQGHSRGVALLARAAHRASGTSIPA